MATEEMDSTYKIGAFARAAGVGVETVRYYERQGLLPKPARMSAVHHGGYRQYGAEDLRRVRFILRAKELGFTLKEIGGLLALRAERPGSCSMLREEASRRLADVETRLRDLGRIRDALQRLVAQCPGSAELSECPILEFLEQ